LAKVTYSWENLVLKELQNIKSNNLYRTNRVFDLFGIKTIGKAKEIISFASNDYLGLSKNETVIKEATNAIKRYGSSSQASRLIVGTRSLHIKLEKALADFKKTEAALVFPTGYQTNVGVLSSFGFNDCVIVSDELNHASIIDGAKLAKSEVVIYRHCDLVDLKSKLERVVTEGKRPIIVTDLIFSMDGDIAPIENIANCAKDFNALLVVDEAHAPLGPYLELDEHGRYLGCEILQIGTLSKVFGSLGGFVAGKSCFIDFLINRARSFIFTTALSPADAGAALGALKVLTSEQGEILKNALQDNINLLCDLLGRSPSLSPVIPFVVGSEQKAIRLSQYLMDYGIFVPAIRPPSVPRGTSRLRISLSSLHEKSQIELLAKAIKSVDV
jgi:8-amino-7-oxononanoate synthase